MRAYKGWVVTEAFIDDVCVAADSTFGLHFTITGSGNMLRWGVSPTRSSIA